MPTRTDPPVSEAQRRAMRAAESGNSNVGIPRSVGKEFSEADPGGKLPEHAKDDSAPDINAFGSGNIRLGRADAASEHLAQYQAHCADSLRGHPAMRDDAWSEEAREAAAEARRKKSGGSFQEQGQRREAEYRPHLNAIQKRVNSGELSREEGVQELKHKVKGQTSGWYNAVIS